MLARKSLNRIVRMLFNCGNGPEIIERVGARRRSDSGKTMVAKRADQSLLGESTSMGHVKIAGGHGRAEPVKNIEGRNRAARRDVGRLG